MERPTIEYSNQKVQKQTTFFNILVRTSGRPNCFAACISSIREQTYQNFQIIVSYDDDATYEYLRLYQNIGIVPVEQNHHPQPRRAGSDQSIEPFLPNLYFNALLDHIREGFILFLDDDDRFLLPNTLDIIDRHIQTTDDLLFWQVRMAQSLLIPSDANFGKPPIFGQINTSGFCFHSKYVPTAEWDGWRGGDYFVATKLYNKVPNKIYIHQALTGSQNQRAMPGFGLRNDIAINFSAMKEQYERMGYLPPFRLMTEAAAHRFLNQVQTEPHELPMDWTKGYAASSRVFYEMATRPDLMERVSALLGPDVLLWGCSIVTRPGKTAHAWHCDIEASAPQNGKTLNVWIGLKNTTINSGLHFIPFSHTFESIQQIRHEKGVGRQAVDREQILAWAKARNPQCQVMRPELSDGEALFFNGKMWHGSNNVSEKTRFALLLQYATPEAAIRLPDVNNFEWPFRQMAHPKPPVILLQGDDRTGNNRLVQAPPPQQTPGNYLMYESRIYPLEIPLKLPENSKWKPFHIFNGATANMQHFTCHVSALVPGNRPHPPHDHKEEEILMILDGEADVILPEIEAPEGRKRRLTRGDFVYYPAHFQHTLEATGEEPANYIMFKWYNPKPAGLRQLSFGQYNGIATDHQTNGSSINFRLLFEGTTTCLHKLHGHASVLLPGAGYAPHCDPYDVAIIVLEGQVKTLDQVVDPHHVIFYPAGTMHGMINPTDKIARYLVFEFHGQHVLQDRQIKPVYSMEMPHPAPTSVPANGNVIDRSSYDALLKQYRALETSYSLKIGRSITRMAEKSLAWLPFVGNRMKGK